MTIVAVGKSSFLARAVAEIAPGKDWIFLGHKEALANTSWADKAQCVVNFAYAPGNEIDTRLAKLIKMKTAHYVMLSSRLVYGQGPDFFGLKEGRSETPSNAYGTEKLVAEKAMASSLDKNRLTILRMGNVFGNEPGRKTFFGHALTGLKKSGKITFDMSPDSQRDFLPVSYCAQAIVKIAQAPKPGLFNLGSGFGTTCGEIAEWLIEGNGQGELVVTDNRKHDQFWLDMTKTRDTYKLPLVTREAIKDSVLDIFVE